MKPIQRIISIIFCWAILFLPNIGLYSQQSSVYHYCLESEVLESNEKINKGEKHCESHCCVMHQMCSGCFAFVINEKYSADTIVNMELLGKQNFFYKIPYILSISHSIWQPPKIG